MAESIGSNRRTACPDGDRLQSYPKHIFPIMIVLRDLQGSLQQRAAHNHQLNRQLLDQSYKIFSYGLLQMAWKALGKMIAKLLYTLQRAEKGD